MPKSGRPKSDDKPGFTSNKFLFIKIIKMMHFCLNYFFFGIELL